MPVPRSHPRLDESMIFAVLSLVGIVIATHVTLADFDFVTADRATLVYNGFGARLADLWPLVNGSALAGGVPDAWHPLTVLTRMIDRAAFGLWPTGYHIHNVIWHTAAVLLVAAWVRRAFGSDRLAWLVAALFACWPSHAAATVVIGHRDVVIATVAIAGALTLLLRGARGPAALVVGLGLLAHELTLAIFLLWPLVRWMRGQSFSTAWRGAGRDLLWLTAGPAAALTVRIASLPNLSLPAILDRGGFFAVAGAMARTVLLQLGQLVVPVGLSEIHPDPAPGWPAHLEWPVLALGLAALVLASRRGWDRLLLGGAWFALIGLVPVLVPWALPQIWADHFLYLPTMGVALIGGRLIDRFAWPSRARWPIVGLAAAVVVLLHQQTENLYQDDVTIWARAETVAPNDVRTQRGSIALALGAGNVDTAERMTTRALERFPEDPILLADAAVIACLHDAEHRAQEWFKAVPLERHPDPARLLLQRAGCALRHQRFNRAIESASAAHDLSPWMPDPLAVRGLAHEGLRRDADAERDLLAASQLAPQRRDIWTNLATFYEKRGYHEKANEIRRYTEALAPAQ